jgi:hypothetical protein
MDQQKSENSLKEGLNTQTPGPAAEPKSEPKKQSKLLFLVIVLVVVLAWGGVAVAVMLVNKDSNTEENVVTNGQEETEEEDPYEGWKDYTNPTYGYSLKYPSDWELEESEEIDCADYFIENPKTDGGCYDYELASKVTITSSDNSLRFVIDYGSKNYGHMYTFWTFEKDRNIEEYMAEISLFGEEGVKGQIFCDWTADASKWCYEGRGRGEDGVNLSHVYYYYELECSGSDCNMPILMKDPMGNDLYIEVQYYKDGDEQMESTWSEETEATVDMIVNSLRMEDPYEGWKTYTAPTGEYSLKYPKDWELDVDGVGCGPIFQKEGDESGDRWITLCPYSPEEESLKAILDSHTSGVDYFVSNKEEIKVDSKDAIMFTTQTLYFENTAWELRAIIEVGPDEYFEFKAYVESDEKDESFFDIAELILNSIVFE